MAGQIGAVRHPRDRLLAKEQIRALMDGDTVQATGTVTRWCEYRKALRSYPEPEGFPNKDKRLGLLGA